MAHKELEKLKVKALSPFHIYFDGEAVAVSANNSVGPFDVLPGHTDFFSILNAGEVAIDTGEGTEMINFTISNGILSVRDNEVTLFANI